ncbi:Transposase IS3/IS911 [Nitrosospira multiformis ATCC 25196]|uniref:Transposase IS3/IS911 n=2 Tax=Nitrosospira multiformis (strain ATCC 25196 / NCIMB 11849 / C 71) TaxID=323848 RepID=Q2Y8C9_NITMU|nr:Transposase IS3/IS911 [Nitrosospira multiformis ATCC 25196]
MKKKRFSIEQIVAVLKQAELGMPVADLIRQVGISEQTFYRWKKQYAGMQSDQVRELKQLQEENGRLKKLVADLSLDRAILQDVASKKWPMVTGASTCFSSVKAGSWVKTRCIGFIAKSSYSFAQSCPGAARWS